VRLDSAFSSSATGTNDESNQLTIEAVSSPRAILVRRESGAGGTTLTTLHRTIGLAWALFLPWDIALSPSWWTANAGWLAVLILPVSFFSIRAARRPPEEPVSIVSWWSMVIVVASLAGIPVAMGLSSLGPGEWAGVALGIVGALMIERWSAAEDTRT
jgi:hypothetical protein